MSRFTQEKNTDFLRGSPMRLFAVCLLMLFCNTLKSFDKVVIWGHKLHSHTHSYIHNAFYRAFQEMRYPIFWFDGKDNVSHFDFANTLFITEGQCDQGIPLRNDCLYVLHNCEGSKYKAYYEKKQAILLQVYTDDVLTRPSCEKMSPCIYYDVKSQCLYMPWATDLLPREIDAVKKSLPGIKKTKKIAWVGTIGGGYFGNVEQIDPFIRAAATQRIGFKKHGNLSLEENLNIVRSSYMAPAIVGKWQQEKGYIPCRIFKNISYGQMGITNSERVYEVFEGKIVYNPDSYQLFFDAQRKMKIMTTQELYVLMDFVRDRHTYINRVQTILDFIEKVQKS